MRKRRKPPCVNTNGFCEYFYQESKHAKPGKRCQLYGIAVGGVSTEQECHSHHQLSWLHLPDPAMHTHTHLNAIPTFSVHLPWLSKPMYTILTVVEI